MGASPALRGLLSASLVAVLAALGPGIVEARRPVSGEDKTLILMVNANAKCGAARVAISVSPLIHSKELRVLELYWDFEGAQLGDQVALYDYDPVLRRQWDDNRNEPVSDAPAAPPLFGARPSQPPQPGGGVGAYAPFNPNPFGPQGVGGGGGSGGQPYGQPYDPYGYPPRPYSAGPGPAGYAGYPHRDAFSGRARRQAGGGSGDDVELSDQPSSSASSGPPLAVIPTDGLKSGWRATNVQERHTPSSQLGYKSRCLRYWAVYERSVGENQTEVLAVSCLRTRPTWMSDFRKEIGRMRLYDLFIPGSHDSASIQEDGRQNIIDRYTVTQDESILGQLIYGVRYIDLRVGFYPNKDVQWWANHGPVRMTPLMSVLHDVKAFMDNTNEIVILDLQNFPAGFGKDNKVHMKLVHLLETELGELMAFREQGWGSTLEDMWSSTQGAQGSRRLIVAYDKEDVLPASRKLWPAVRQFWGNVQTPEQLAKYAEAILSQPGLRGFPWALMAELTPNARLIATNPTGSLRRLAHRVNRNVTSWAEGAWGEAINTLAVDFVRSTGVVEAALWHNLRRSGVDACGAHRLLGSV